MGAPPVSHSMSSSETLTTSARAMKRSREASAAARAPSSLSARNLLRSLLRDASMMSTSHTPHLSSLTDLILASGNVRPPFW